MNRATLRRFLAPKSVAVVGASEASPRHAVRALLDSDLDIHLVNPRHDTVFGRSAVPDLKSLAGQVDAVLTLVNARAAVATVADAAAIGAAGVAVNAAGFAEIGAAGQALQAQLVSAAGDATAVLGPNCNGFVNARTGAFLAGAPELPLRPGSIGVVTHSGGFITDLAVAARDRGVGFSSLISTGNEAVTDMVDYFEYFVDDPDTDAVCLVVERISRPAAFFAAAERAHSVGKPVVALKLGRSSRGRAVARSHTGAVVGDSWTYDAAFHQYGIVSARDLGDLLDRVLLFDRLPRHRWTSAAGVGIVTVSGGGAALASDVCEEEGVVLPALDALGDSVRAVLPAAGVLNPLDLTGFVMNRPEAVRDILAAYVASSEVDAVLTMWTLGLREQGFADALLMPFRAAAADADKPFLLSATADGRVSDWAAAMASDNLVVSPNLRTSVRSLASMRQFALAAASPPRGTPVSVPKRHLETSEVVITPDGNLLTFAAVMNLLGSYGIATAPYVLMTADQPGLAVLPFPGPYVVKLADCAHRTELNAVRIGVTANALPAVVADLGAIAQRHGLPSTVAVQPLVEFDGELFLGAQPADLGPVVVCGFGGVQVEAGRIAGRIAPLSTDDAVDAITEIDTAGTFTGFRGAAPWDRAAAVDAMLAISDIAMAAHPWLASLDVNPLVRTPEGFIAVDATAYVYDAAIGIAAGSLNNA